MQPLAPQGYGTPNPYQPQQVVPEAHRLEPSAQVSERTVQLLHQTRPWVMFLSVLMYIGSGGMVLAGLAMFAMGAIGSAAGGGKDGMPFAALGLVYLPLAALYVYPAMKLWGYGSAVGRLTTSRATGDLEAALSEQKSFWKFIGISTIVVFALYILAFVGVAVVGIGAASMIHK